MKCEYQPLTIYNTAQFGPGETIPKEMRFSFGADGSDDSKFALLAELHEHQLTLALLDESMLCERLFSLVGLHFPEVWILVEPLTPRIAPSWKEPQPGDLDLVCGSIRDGRPSLDSIACFQIKIRKQRRAKTVGETGRGQAEWTARMGFDRTVLLHLLVQEPSPTEDHQAGSWNPVKNSVFLDSIKRTVGLMRREIENDRLPYGYTILGWGQAFGEQWNVCGGFTFETMREAPLRPFSSDAASARDEIRASAASILSAHEGGILPMKINLSQHRE